MNSRSPYDVASDPRASLPAEHLAEAQTSAYPVVAKQLVRRDRVGLMFGGSIAMLLGALTLFMMASVRGKTASVSAPVVSQSPAPMVMAPAPPLAAPVMAPPAMVPPTPVPPVTAASPSAAPMSMPMVAPMPPVALANANAVLERLRAPALILDNGPGGPAAAMAGPAAAAAAAGQAAKAAGKEGLSPEEQFAQRVNADADATPARRMSDPSSIVAQGTMMTAVLETAINSDLPGFARAVISRDVKSYDGKRVLIARGTHLIGEYKSGLQLGQSRVYILWTRLLRPDGVSIALASPATDFAGGNGLGGKVDSHFSRRFGAAILLSAIGAAGQAIGGGNGAIILAAPQAALGSGAQRDVNIPPTVKVALGAPIRIFTARDLDFSGLGQIK